ncbi:MAG TPA: outer membrane beta-barrel protein [Chitinophagaceae bacterium]|nr:outer membrane beta-barrel protein [Chitinophagaceae bacterium]
MKKILFLFLVCGTLGTYAQTEKGNLMVGGQLNLNTNEDGSEFRFNPQLGYFFANNFAAGGQFSFDFSKAGNVRVNEFGIGPFARYYFGKGQTKPFLVSAADYLSVSTKINNIEVNSNGWSFLVGGGFAAFINRTVAIEGIIGYRYADYSNSSGTGGLNLSLGFQLYFGKDLPGDIKKTVTGN